MITSFPLTFRIRNWAGRLAEGSTIGYVSISVPDGVVQRNEDKQVDASFVYVSSTSAPANPSIVIGWGALALNPGQVVIAFTMSSTFAVAGSSPLLGLQ